jgi:hypothetical protein
MGTVSPGIPYMHPNLGKNARVFCYVQALVMHLLESVKSRSGGRAHWPNSFLCIGGRRPVATPT